MKGSYRKRCKACQVARHDATLRRRIVQSTYFNKDIGIETPHQIHQDYQKAFSYPSLLNHARDHVTFTEAHRRQLEQRVKPKTYLIQTPAAAIETAKADLSDEVFTEIIDKGLDKLKTGELQITTANLIAAADSKANLALKRKDQQLKIQEMIWHFASGEAKGNIAYDQRLIEGETPTDYNATAVTADNVSRRTPRPGTVH